MNWAFFRNKFIQHVHLIRFVYKIMPFLYKLIVMRMQFWDASWGCSGRSFLLSASIWSQQFNTLSAEEKHTDNLGEILAANRSS